jgi:hypothetical protein
VGGGWFLLASDPSDADKDLMVSGRQLEVNKLIILQTSQSGHPKRLGSRTSFVPLYHSPASNVSPMRSPILLLPIALVIASKQTLVSVLCSEGSCQTFEGNVCASAHHQ